MVLLSLFQKILETLPPGFRSPSDYSKAEKLFRRHLGGGNVFFLLDRKEGLTPAGSLTGPAILVSDPIYRHLIRKRSFWTAKEKTRELSAWELVVPVFSGKRFLGAIGLGPKKNKKPFSQDEKKILEWLSIFFREPMGTRAVEAETEDVQRQAALGFLSGVLAHEIRNPLTAIQTLLQLFPRKFGEERFRTEFQKIMSQQIQRLQYLSENYLHWIKTGPDLDFPASDLTAAADRTVELLRPLFKSKAAQLDWTPSGPAWVGVGVFQLESLLLNLIQNAYHALAGEKGRVEVSIVRRERIAEKRGAWVELSVSDNGRGILKADLKKIFDPFFTTRDGSTGLGLLICRRILESSGGFLIAQSPGPGKTCFKAYFPWVSPP